MTGICFPPYPLILLSGAIRKEMYLSSGEIISKFSSLPGRVLQVCGQQYQEYLQQKDFVLLNVFIFVFQHIQMSCSYRLTPDPYGIFQHANIKRHVPLNKSCQLNTLWLIFVFLNGDGFSLLLPQSFRLKDEPSLFNI